MEVTNHEEDALQLKKREEADIHHEALCQAFSYQEPGQEFQGEVDEPQGEIHCH